MVLDCLPHQAQMAQYQAQLAAQQQASSAVPLAPKGGNTAPNMLGGMFGGGGGGGGDGGGGGGGLGGFGSADEVLRARAADDALRARVAELERQLSETLTYVARIEKAAMASSGPRGGGGGGGGGGGDGELSGSFSPPMQPYMLAGRIDASGMLPVGVPPDPTVGGYASGGGYAATAGLTAYFPQANPNAYVGRPSPLDAAPVAPPGYLPNASPGPVVLSPRTQRTKHAGGAQALTAAAAANQSSKVASATDIHTEPNEWDDLAIGEPGHAGGRQPGAPPVPPFRSQADRRQWLLSEKRRWLVEMRLGNTPAEPVALPVEKLPPIGRSTLEAVLVGGMRVDTLVTPR